MDIIKKRSSLNKRVIDMRKKPKFTAMAALERLLAVFQDELGRLEAKAIQSSLSQTEIKNMAILLDSLSKIKEEVRREKKQSVLEGLSSEEIIQKVREATEILKDDH